MKRIGTRAPPRPASEESLFVVVYSPLYVVFFLLVFLFFRFSIVSFCVPSRDLRLVLFLLILSHLCESNAPEQHGNNKVFYHWQLLSAKLLFSTNYCIDQARVV